MIGYVFRRVGDQFFNCHFAMRFSLGHGEITVVCSFKTNDGPSFFLLFPVLVTHVFNTWPDSLFPLKITVIKSHMCVYIPEMEVIFYNDTTGCIIIMFVRYGKQMKATNLFAAKWPLYAMQFSGSILRVTKITW